MNAHYYLHSESRDLIHKRLPIDPSDFTEKIWSIDTSNRADAWTIILEALALDAGTKRITELAKTWECDARDLLEFMVRDPNGGSDLQRKGVRLFLSEIVGVDPDVWFDWAASTPKGEKPDFNAMPSGKVSPELAN